MILLELFWGFLRVGCFSFGGGYAAISLIREIVLSNGWLSDEMLSYIIAVSESTPGPIMVNLATYVGSSQAGILGAAIATFSVVLPAFCIILALMAVLRRFVSNPWVKAMMTGLKACVTGLIFATAIDLLLSNCLPNNTPDLTAVVLTLVIAGLYFGFQPVFKRKLSPITLIAISAVFGIVAYGI